MHTPVDTDALEASLTLAGERGGDLTAQIYALLFEREPQLQPLFWRDQNDSIKGEMLARAFEAILDFVGERRHANNLIKHEIMAHEDYEVSREVFPAFFHIMAEVVQNLCDDEWTPAMNYAWQQTLTQLHEYVDRAA